MDLCNVIQENSFKYTASTPDLLKRSNEIAEFGEIVAVCIQNQEDIIANSDIFSIEVEYRVNLADWLYGGLGQGKHDDRARLLEYFSKSIKIKEADDKKTVIKVSLGKYNNCACDLDTYYSYRRRILIDLKNVNEFASFMRSCFASIIFADQINSHLKKITNFDNYTEEIVNGLAVLNDEGLIIFKNNKDNPKEAYKELTKEVKRKCSPESREHFKDCTFSFTVEEESSKDGEKKYVTRNILCSPHIKLIHPGSNLRIYFNWNDSEIGKGEKILIGSIGGHPY